MSAVQGKKCKYCSRPAEYRSWVYTLKARSPTKFPKPKKGETRKAATQRQLSGWLKKVYQNVCEAHLLEDHFQLFPYECTKACIKKRMASNELKMDAEDMVIWFPLAPMLGGEKPKCGWCGKVLKPSKNAGTLAKAQES